ncbi:hypothetical protein [Amycolatopsis alkalitolerans]|uniref:Uncharacterized protein n=1 Tax=Amycolatopsis alkalitolerans TaxID=2547244 RepID=A0A5C4M4F2_9PSEU|nr:hypothetical protein [Amycolatopsis alkalitolerans]TNC26090.1 hypothetical protein FG385_13045 [Amycolatopsis alkalitolerans]
MTIVSQQSDPDSLEHVAGKVEDLHDRFKDSKQKMIGVAGPNPFGDIRHPDHVPGEHPSEHAVSALQSYRDRMHGQFDAAAELMKSTGGALRDAARALRGTDDAARDSVTVKDGSLDQ